jgi:hypothetical protein
MIGGQKASISIYEDIVIVRRDSPVLAVIVFLWVIFLVVGEEGVELDALFEVLDGLHAADLLEEVEVAVDVDAGADQSVPVDALQLDVGVVLLELEVDRLVEVDVGPLYCVHVLSGHLELVEVEILGEDLHFFLKLISIILFSMIISFIFLLYSFENLP